MYVFSTPQNDIYIYRQGVDEGRRQVLANIAKIVHDVKSDCDGDPCTIAGEMVHDYLEQEGYL